jgi:hypothetical protein
MKKYRCLLHFYLIVFCISGTICAAQRAEVCQNSCRSLSLDTDLIEEGLVKARTNSGCSLESTKYFSDGEQLAQDILCELKDVSIAAKNYQDLIKKRRLIDFDEATKFYENQSLVDYADKSLACAKKLLENSTDQDL